MLPNNTNVPQSPPLPPIAPVPIPPPRKKKWPFIVGGIVVLLAVVVFVLTYAEDPNPESQQAAVISFAISGARAPFLISANIPPPRGFDLFTISDFLTKNGATLYVHSANWDTLEPSPNQYAIKNVITPAFQGLIPKYPFKGVVLILKMIDSNTRTMPADLRGKPFDDPQVEERFLAMLHAVATSPGVAGHVQYILLGNEVDGYFLANPKELNGFMSLLKKSIDQLHQDLPGVKVGTITTADALKHPDLFKTLTQYSDYINYTYYPLGGRWQMRPVSDAAGDLAKMAAAAGDKWFGFTELGYSTSPQAGSSEAQQADFMKAVFASLDTYKNQVAYVNWAGVSDTPDDVCKTYAKQQGLPDADAFCGYGSYTGLRTYDNQPKASWDIFVKEMARVKTPTATPTVTIDQTSLSSTSKNPTITGTAANISTVQIAVRTNPPEGKLLFLTATPVQSGRWSITLVPGISRISPQSFSNGTYVFVVSDTKSNVRATGTLAVTVATTTPDESAPVRLRIKGKIALFEKQLSVWFEAGGDPHEILPLEKEFETRSGANDLTGTETVLDRLLNLVTHPPSYNLNEFRYRLKEKMNTIQRQGPAWVQEGGDIGEIESRGKKFDAFIAGAKYEDAEKMLGEIVALVGQPPVVNLKLIASRIDEKMRSFALGVGEYIKRGGNPLSIFMIQAQIENSLREGKYEKAQQLLDQALQGMQKTPETEPTPTPPTPAIDQTPLSPTPPQVEAPTASLTASSGSVSGAHDITVNVGDRVDYTYINTNCASAARAISVDGGEFHDWPMPSGTTMTCATTTTGGVIAASQAGHTYVLKYTVTNGTGGSASASATVQVNGTSASNPYANLASVLSVIAVFFEKLTSGW